MNKIPKKIQSRNWQLIIPSEWEQLQSIKDICMRQSKFHYFIEHQRDLHENGEPKFYHWHLLLIFKNSRDLGTVANYFKDIQVPIRNAETNEIELKPIPSNSLEKIVSPDWAKRYLIHADNPEKFQYDLQDVETNDKMYKDLFIEHNSKIDETEYTIEVFEQVEEFPSFSKFLSCFKHQLYTMSAYQRNSQIMALKRFYRENVDSDLHASFWDDWNGEYTTKFEQRKKGERKQRELVENNENDNAPF